MKTLILILKSLRPFLSNKTDFKNNFVGELRN